MTTSFPGESAEYRAARDKLLHAEVEALLGDVRSSNPDALVAGH